MCFMESSIAIIKNDGSIGIIFILIVKNIKQQEF